MWKITLTIKASPSAPSYFKGICPKIEIKTISNTGLR